MTESKPVKETAEEKTERILEMLADGHTREEIGDHYHQTWKTIDMHMRRRGYSWDKDQQTYVIKEEEKRPSTDEIMLLDQTKAGCIARQFQVKYPDARQIAQKQGFESIEEMGEYMEAEGYRWNDHINGYEFVQQPIQEIEKPKTALPSHAAQPMADASNGDIILTEQELMAFLLKHQVQLQKLLIPNNAGDLPSVRFRGKASNKTFTLADALQVLIEDYKAEYKVNYREIIEVALYDFFEKYGYAARLAVVKY